MNEYKLAQGEARFTGLIWRHEPIAFIGSSRLSDRQAEELKKLIDRHKEG